MGAEIVASSLPTQEEVQRRYDAAQKAGVSPCAWLPPEWKSVRIANGRRTIDDNSANDTGFNNVADGASNEADERVKEGDKMDPPGGPELPPADNKWANPFSDFTHVDESEYPNGDVDELEFPLLAEVAKINQDLSDKIKIVLRGPDRALQDLINKALRGKHSLRKEVKKALRELVLPKSARDTLIGQVKAAWDTSVSPTPSDVEKAINDAPPAMNPLLDLVETIIGNESLRNRAKKALLAEDPVGRLKRIVGPGSPGMKRLALIFEWALHRATVLLGAINQALESKRTDKEAQSEYETARTNFIQFIRDLDDHEPEKKDKPLDVKKIGQPSGYGRSLKWVCIDPVIFQGRIVGARVIIHWNPHSSSNGIPIKHP